LVGGDTFFPAGWSEWMRTLSPAFLAQQPAGSDKLDTPAGAQWWLNIAVPQARIAKPWPSGPDDMFVGLGVFGQTLFLIPSKNAIVIRLSHDLVGGFDRDGLLREAMAIIDAKPPETLANQAPELVVEQEFQDLESLKRTYDGTSFSQLLANYFAKELCTCLFQIGQSEEVCRSDVKYTSLAIRYEILGDTKEVATRNFSARARAKLVDDRSGCKIIEPAI
jgi:CubicO group peptidase (beta-lactamase class C family)